MCAHADGGHCACACVASYRSMGILKKLRMMWSRCSMRLSGNALAINGKRDAFTADDLIALAHVGDVKKTRARTIIEELDAAVGRWLSFADQAGIDESTARRIEVTHRRLAALA